MRSLNDPVIFRTGCKGVAACGRMMRRTSVTPRLSAPATFYLPENIDYSAGTWAPTENGSSLVMHGAPAPLFDGLAVGMAAGNFRLARPVIPPAGTSMTIWACFLDNQTAGITNTNLVTLGADPVVSNAAYVRIRCENITDEPRGRPTARAGNRIRRLSQVPAGWNTFGLSLGNGAGAQINLSAAKMHINGTLSADALDMTDGPTAANGAWLGVGGIPTSTAGAWTTGGVISAVVISEGSHLSNSDMEVLHQWATTRMAP